jgi:hypothetical protein
MTEVELRIALESGWTLATATLRYGSVISLLLFTHEQKADVRARFDLGKRVILDECPVEVSAEILARVADKLSRRNDRELSGGAY